MIGFYVAVALLVIRVRRITLALAAILLTAILVLALILEATVSDGVGGYAALGLFAAVVMVVLAVQFGAWVETDDDADPD